MNGTLIQIIFIPHVANQPSLKKLKVLPYQRHSAVKYTTSKALSISLCCFFQVLISLAFLLLLRLLLARGREDGLLKVTHVR